MRYWQVMILGIFSVSIQGCVSQAGINESFAQIERIWQVEYQQTEDQYRYRVTNADHRAVLYEARKTFIDLGMAVIAESAKDGYVIAQSNAPSPLSKDEWEFVVDQEDSRVKAISNGTLTMRYTSKVYIVTAIAYVMHQKGKTFILLDYFISAPKYEAMGYRMTKHAPPTAVRLVMSKFWRRLDERLSVISMTPARKRTKKEKRYSPQPQDRVKQKIAPYIKRKINTGPKEKLRPA